MVVRSNSTSSTADEDSRRWLVELINSLVDPKKALLFCRERFQQDGELQKFESLLESIARSEDLAVDKRTVIQLFLNKDCRAMFEKKDWREPEEW